MQLLSRWRTGDKMNKSVPIFCFCVLVFIFIHLGITFAEEKNNERNDQFSSIEFYNGLLRVSLKNYKLQKVIAELSQKTGIQIISNKPEEEYRTVTFDYLPVESAFKRLFKGRNFVFLYRSDDTPQSARLTKILVFAKSGDRSLAGFAENMQSPSNSAEQTVAAAEMQYLNQKIVEEVLQNMPRNNEALKQEFYNSLELIRDQGGFEELLQQIENAIENLPDNQINLRKEISDALEQKRLIQQVIKENP
jgi:hypothetical protein